MAKRNSSDDAQPVDMVGGGRDEKKFPVSCDCEECPRIIGPNKPCRGLVLLGRRCASTYSVCNPSTGGVLHLPPCLTDFPYYDSSAGIGFHEPTGEYKVVVIAEPTDTRPFLWLEGPRRRLHWVTGTTSLRTDNKYYRRILAFSLATESFYKMPLPSFVADDIRRTYRHESDPYKDNPRKPGYITCCTPVGPVLAELDGSHCMVRDLRHRDDIEIWKLADYDESGEWSLDYRIDLAPLQQHLMTTWLVAPLCYLDDDEDNTTRKSSRKIMLATAMQKVHVYDPETRTLETVLSAVAGDFGAVAEIRGIAHSGELPPHRAGP
ncbi:hypothetical protein QOZ80_2BG0181130 [Eleusine coracana subsp. coracana]|nr:hypothetical protein QOZ80_2BG0181130 [Eleusine coracana subsp. coracana]